MLSASGEVTPLRTCQNPCCNLAAYCHKALPIGRKYLCIVCCQAVSWVFGWQCQFSKCEHYAIQCRKEDLQPTDPNWLPADFECTCLDCETRRATIEYDNKEYYPSRHSDSESDSE
jgi:hypothetical protein